MLSKSVEKSAEVYHEEYLICIEISSLRPIFINLVVHYSLSKQKVFPSDHFYFFGLFEDVGSS